MTTNFDFKGSRRLGKEEICTKGVSDSKKKKKKKRRGVEWESEYFAFLHPPPNQTKSKSNMAA